jgi:hypothetical protein
VLLGGLLAGQAMAGESWVSGKGGTLGLGVEAGYAPNRWVDVRMAAQAFFADEDRDEAGIEYAMRLELATAQLSLNWHPFGGAFRLGAGALVNESRLQGASLTSDLYYIGEGVYSSDEVGQLNATVGFDSIAPYAGAGWDFRFGDDVSVTIDVGLLRPGNVDVDLFADGPMASDPVFQHHMERERAELASAFSDFELHPVFALGLSWSF